MKVPAGYEVQLVASEREFPELAKPDQINFDSQGRLWVSCMPTYPQWKPGDPRPNDRLLILDQIDPQTGRAGRCQVYYDKLTCPTGFEFWKGGVLVMDEPRMLWLKGENHAETEGRAAQRWLGHGRYPPLHQCLAVFPRRAAAPAGRRVALDRRRDAVGALPPQGRERMLCARSAHLTVAAL